MRLPLALIVMLFTLVVQAADPTEKQTLQARRVQSAPRVDGILNDAEWIADDAKVQFHQFLPNNGAPSEITLPLKKVWQAGKVNIFFQARTFSA